MELRKSHSLSREEFAEFLGVSKFTVRNIEQGQIDATESLQRLLDYVEKDLRERAEEAEIQPA